MKFPEGGVVVPTDDKGGIPNKQVTPPAGEGEKDKGGNDKDAMVPSWRLKDESDKRRDVESKLAEYQKKEAAELEQKKKAEEDEAKKKGEYEGILSSKDSEIAAYKSKEVEWSKKVETVKTMADNKLKDFESKYGKELLDKAKALIGSDDPWTILEKIDSVVGLIGEKKPAGGSTMPGTGGGLEKNLQYYKEKVGKGEKLNAVEEKEYFQLLEKMDN